MDDIYKGSQEVGICSTKTWGCMVDWGRTLYPSFVIASYGFRRVCSCVVVLKDFTKIVVFPNSRQILLQGFKSFECTNLSYSFDRVA